MKLQYLLRFCLFLVVLADCVVWGMVVGAMIRGMVGSVVGAVVWGVVWGGLGRVATPAGHPDHAVKIIEYTSYGGHISY